MICALLNSHPKESGFVRPGYEFQGAGTINEKNKAKKDTELIDKIYQLGYEVGYNNHSEIGWVLRDKSGLFKEAKELSVESPENYYNDGKTKGKLNRGQEIDRVTWDKTNSPAKVSPPETKDRSAENKKRASFLPHNKLSELPQMVKKIRVTEVPALLKGIRYLRLK